MSVFKNNNRNHYLKALIAIFFLFPLKSIGNNYETLTGLGKFEFLAETNKKINVWYYRPNNHQNITKVLFVMHGTKRNAIDYRNQWINHADTTGTLILSPEFSKDLFPGVNSYHLGNIVNKDHQTHPKSQWTYAIIDMIFEYVKHIEKSDIKTFDIYGHSAGAQFVHRMVLFSSQSKIGTAIAANAGWYTITSEKFDFPYGLKKSPTSEVLLKNSLSKHLIILLGENDTNQNHKYLRKTGEAKAQGKHRLARGRFFFKQALKLAKEINSDFNWKIEIVDDTGHSNTKMSLAAANLLKKD